MGQYFKFRTMKYKRLFGRISLVPEQTFLILKEHDMATNISNESKHSIQEQQVYLSLHDVLQITPLSRTGVYDRLNPKSKYYDATFPRPVKFGERKNRWVKEEVQEWLEALKAKRFDLRTKGAKNEC